MADRAVASLFATFFEFLAKNPSEDNVEFARELWGKTSDYDFAYYQMDADNALIDLGLAREKMDPDSGEFLEYEYANSQGEFDD